MATATIETVSDTAFWVAHYRGVETTRTDALFRDPLAAVLAGDRGRQIAEAMPRPFITAWVIAVRTRIIDDFISGAVARGVDTVLNLGAGLDTRPYRMELPASLTWIEADYPRVIDYKADLLAGEAPRFRLSRVKCDLANSAQRGEVLARADANAGKMLVLTEGVIPYLNVEEVGALARELRELKHIGYWIVDYLSPEVLKFRKRLMGGKMQNAPFRFRPDDWFGFFEEHGWVREDMRYLGVEGDRLGRQVQLPTLAALITAVRGIFMSKERRDRFKNAAGYALLVPRKT